MSRACLAVIVLLTATHAFGDVFSYECNSFPEEAGWEIVQIYCDPDLWVDGGWFFAHVQLCEGDPPPGGQKASYRRTLDEFIGVDAFFVEWRMETDGDRSELPWGGPSNFSLWSLCGVNYGFSIASDHMDLNRDNTLPIVEVDFEAGIPHTHRLELYGDELYVWYLDGEIVDAGVPEGPFPCSYEPNIGFRAKAAFLENTTQWDYIRYGTLPEDGSGDWDSDGDVDMLDYYRFLECFGGPDTNAGPGCRFCDFDADTDVDVADFAGFQSALDGPR